MGCTNHVSGIRRIGGQRRKESEGWNEEVSGAVAEKRRALEKCHREEIGFPVTDVKVKAERAVKVAKRMADWGWESDCGMISRVTKRCFGKR